MAVVYLVSIVTPSIWGPLQVVGATAGAVIGFIVPGMLALLPTDAQLTRQVLPLGSGLCAAPATMRHDLHVGFGRASGSSRCMGKAGGEPTAPGMLALLLNSHVR